MHSSEVITMLYRNGINIFLDDKPKLYAPIADSSQSSQSAYYTSYEVKDRGEESIKINHRDYALKMLQRIRDEAHRFGITFHRQKRSIAFIKSELEQIEGIGAKSLNALLKRFKTVSNVRQASVEELTEVVGLKRAQAIVKYFGIQN